MKKVILFSTCIAAAATMAACGGPGAKGKAAADTAAAETKAVPEYTVINNATIDLSGFPQDKDGYYVIFDGKTFNGWRGYGKDNVPAKWTIDDGAIKFNGTGGGEEPDPGPEKADWYIHGQTVATPDWGPTAMESASSNIVAYKAAGGEGDFYMVGEMLDEADKAAPYYRGLPALFEFTFWYKLKWALQNGIGCYFVKDILDVQPLYAQYRSDYIEATKLSNHDEDRTGSDLGQSVEKMKVAAAVLLTAQGAPYIYQGEELGYWGTKSNGDEYVRTPILWDKAGNELASGSLSGKIDMQMLTAAISVEAQADDDGSLLNLYRTFARLRNTYPVLAQGKMVKHPVYNDGNTSQQSIAAWYRELDGERMLVVHNFGQETQILTLTDQPDKAVGVSGEVKLQRGDASSKLLMGAWSSVVFAL